jgi:hypothetical protein
MSDPQSWEYRVPDHRSLVRRAIELPFSVMAAGYGGRSFREHAPRLAALVASGAGAALATAITLPITVAVAVLVYVDQRIRREGFGSWS